MAEYTNDLRIKEIGIGEEAGAWGTTLNTQLGLLAEGFSYGVENLGSDANATITMADGASDEARSLYLKITSTSLSATRTVTLAPQSVSKVWIIENATTGSQSITITQGGGQHGVTIPNGQVKIVYSTGDSESPSGVYDALDNLELGGAATAATSVTAPLIEGSTSVQTPLIEYTDGDDAITIADGGGITAANGITSTAAANSFGATSFNDADITNVGSISLDTIVSDASPAAITVGYGGSDTLTINGLTTMTTDGTGDLLTLTSTDAGASISPLAVFYRNSSSPADNDQLGRLKFRGRNDNTQDVDYAEILGQIIDASDGEEDGRFAINTMVAGTSQSRIDIRASETVINNESIDVDFRVESDGSANMLVVDAGNNKVLVEAQNTASVTDAASMIAASAFEINGNAGEGSDILRFFAMADGTGNYGMEVSNSGGTSSYNLCLNPINAGNVGIGTTSPATLLDVKGSTGNSVITLNSAAAIDSHPLIGELRFFSNDNSTNSSGEVGSIEVIGIGTWNGAANSAAMTFNLIQGLAGTTSPVEAMRIDSDGDVGIGRTPSSVNLDIQNESSSTLDALRIRNRGAVAGSAVKAIWSLNRDGSDVDYEAGSILVGKDQNWTTSASTVDSYMAFNTIQNASVAERMRITSSGYVGIGTSSPGTKLEVYDGSITLHAPSGGGNAWTYYKNSDRTYLVGIRGSLSDVLSFYDLTADVQRMQIDTSGNIGAPNGTNIYNASDERLKQNISSLDNSLETIKNLNPVKFNWIDNFVEEENGKTLYGFVAQEVQDVFPDAIEPFADGKEIIVDDKVIENPLTVREKFLVPMLVKAMQEQQIQIEALQAEVKTLKGE